MAVSYGYGTCRGCGETRTALKSGRPWPHDIARHDSTGRRKRICPGCNLTMDDIKPPEPCGRSVHMSSKTPVADRRAAS